MILATDEIVSVIQDKIRDYEKYLEVNEIGYVISVGDGVARIYGHTAPWPENCWILKRASTAWL